MKRKVFGGFVCLILLLSAVFCAPTALADGEFDVVRIKLSIGSPVETPFFVDGNYSIFEDPSVVLPRQLYTVKLEENELRLYYAGTVLYSGATLTLIQHEPTPDRNNFIFMDNEAHGHRGYLGDMHFTIFEGAIRAINHVYLEEYLYGVVPYEMSNSWPIEALKAQTIAARTYAVDHMGGGGSYDMVDTTANQVYKGYNASYANAIAAVDGAGKQVLKCGDAYVPTYYAASNGGQIDIPQHVWSSDADVMPYHVIQPDPFDTANPYSVQEVLIFPKTITDTEKIAYQKSTDGQMVAYDNGEKENAERYLKVSCLSAVTEAGYIAGVTDDIEIVGINSMTAHTYDGKHGLTNDYTGANPCTCFSMANINMTVRAGRYVPNPEAGIMRGDCNGDGKISITDYTLVRLHILNLKPLTGDKLTAADVNKDGKVSITDYTLTRLQILDLKDIPQDPDSDILITEEVAVNFTIDMHAFDDMDGLYRAFNNSSLRLFTIEETDTGFGLYHRRYGHGIGMSQRGAQQMAQTVNPETITVENPEGTTFTGAEILTFYYPNTTIDTLAISKTPLTALGTAPNDTDTNATVDCETSMNVRSEPNTDCTVLGRLPRGCRIQVTQANVTEGWHKINYGEQEAYMSADLVTLDAP